MTGPTYLASIWIQEEVFKGEIGLAELWLNVVTSPVSDSCEEKKIAIFIIRFSCTYTHTDLLMQTQTQLWTTY